MSNESPMDPVSDEGSTSNSKQEVDRPQEPNHEIQHSWTPDSTGHYAYNVQK